MRHVEQVGYGMVKGEIGYSRLGQPWFWVVQAAVVQV
jgi:hypothetical protein